MYFDRIPVKESVSVNPICRVANGVLVKLEAETDKRTLSGEVRLGEVLITTTSKIVVKANLFKKRKLDFLFSSKKCRSVHAYNIFRIRPPISLGKDNLKIHAH